MYLYLDLHGAGGKGSYFLLHAISNTRVHCCSTRKDIISIKVFTDINVALHDAVVGRLMDASRLHTCKINKLNHQSRKHLKHWGLTKQPSAYQQKARVCLLQLTNE